jgi:hypothetical protein
MAKFGKTVGVVVREKGAATVAAETLRGRNGLDVRFMTKSSYTKASEAANGSLRGSITRAKSH